MCIRDRSSQNFAGGRYSRCLQLKFRWDRLPRFGFNFLLSGHGSSSSSFSICGRFLRCSDVFQSVAIHSDIFRLRILRSIVRPTRPLIRSFVRSFVFVFFVFIFYFCGRKSDFRENRGFSWKSRISRKTRIFAKISDFRENLGFLRKSRIFAKILGQQAISQTLIIRSAIKKYWDSHCYRGFLKFAPTPYRATKPP